jgi:osmotically-inducible protein OsmY
MRRIKGVFTGIALTMVVVLGTGISRARQDQGAAQRVGEKLDQAGQSIRKGLEEARDTLRDQFSRARGSVHSMGVASRVYGRLHWDKALTTSTLELEVSNGVVTLRGEVPNARAKARAVELAKETVGITQVIDQLAIQPPQQTTPPTSADPVVKP